MYNFRSYIPRSYFLGNDANCVNAFYFVGYSQPLSWCSLPDADVYMAVTVLTDVKPDKYKNIPHLFRVVDFILPARYFSQVK
jgi:hypothetical protein